MKKYLVVGLSLVMAFCLMGCGKNQTTVTTEDSAEPASIQRASNERQDLILKETGWTYVPGDYPQVSWGAIIENPNSIFSAEFYQLRITFRSADNTVIGTENCIVYASWPRTTIGVAQESSVKGEVTSVEFEILTKEYDWTELNEEDAALLKPLEIINQSENRTDYSLTFTGEVSNSNAFDVESGRVSVIYRNDVGAIVGGSYTYFDIATKDGGTAPFEIYVMNEEVAYASTEFYAQMNPM